MQIKACRLVGKHQRLVSYDTPGQVGTMHSVSSLSHLHWVDGCLIRQYRLNIGILLAGLLRG